MRKLLNIIGWTIILSGTLYFIFTNALQYFSSKGTALNDYRPNFAPFLITHVVAGMVAILLGPLQFISIIRKKYTAVHRMTGKIYLCSVFTGGLASLYLSIPKLIVKENFVTYGAGLAALAFTWLLTSGMAYWSVKNKNFVQHREWMIRSYVVTCAFTTFRLFSNFLVEKFHTEPNATAEVMAWACWAIPLLITETILQGNKILRSASALAKKKAGEPEIRVTTIRRDKETI